MRTKKLLLAKETLRNLSGDQTMLVAGGYLPPPSKKYTNCLQCLSVDCTDICGTQLCGNTVNTQCYCTVSLSPTECV